MDRPRLFVLRNEEIRERAASFVLRDAADMAEVLIVPERLNDGQRMRFHAICGEIAKSGLEWGGREHDRLGWKLLLLSAHAVATQTDVDVIEGLEGETVNLRESVSRMSKKRGSSLIEYATAFAISHGVALRR